MNDDFKQQWIVGSNTTIFFNYLIPMNNIAESETTENDKIWKNKLLSMKKIYCFTITDWYLVITESIKLMDNLW